MIEPSLRPKGAVMVPSKGRTEPFAMAKIFPRDAGSRFIGDHGRKYTGADIMLRHDGQSGSIPVQAVDAAEDERTVLLFKIVCEGIRQEL